MKVVACPRCAKSVEWNPSNRFRPFCSERCKMIDLGAWGNEEYRVPDYGKPDPEPDANESESGGR